MKPRKLKKWLRICAFGMGLLPWVMTHAAQQDIIWGKTDSYKTLLKEFSLTQTTAAPQHIMLPNYTGKQNSVNTFNFLTGIMDNSNVSHVRYNQYYQGLQVWSSQLVFHVSAEHTSVTGSIIKDIESDIKNVNAKISVEQAKNIAVGKNYVKNTVNVEKIVYFDQEVSTKAILAYHVTYATRLSDGPAMLVHIIDANNGKILKKWNALETAQSMVGQGPGGSDLEGGKYKYQFGKAIPGLNALGKFGVLVQDNVCFISNPKFRVINLKNQSESGLPFTLPVSTADETTHQLNPFVYYCSAPNYLNTNDNGFAPVNHGISPVNDTAYFVRQTFNMLVKQYKVTEPVGKEIPLRIYTHLGNYDNAFACGTNCMKLFGIDGPQQLVFGNGQFMFAPLTQGDVVAHEFGHLITDHFSDLIYADQSGGMNEAFSDMTGMTLDDRIRTVLGFSWYSNGADWNLGAATSLNGKPLRYISDPTKDGRSIDHASKYVPNMDPHLSSGVYNKAFYLLSTKKDWTIRKAYEVMLDANMAYWTPSSTYSTGACGVIQAAVKKGYSSQDVTSAFAQVGVTCKVSMENMKSV